MNPNDIIGKANELGVHIEWETRRGLPPFTKFTILGDWHKRMKMIQWLEEQRKEKLPVYTAFVYNEKDGVDVVE